MAELRVLRLSCLMEIEELLERGKEGSEAEDWWVLDER